METLEALFARDRRGDDLALVTADGRKRSYHEVITNAYRAGNTLRHHGVRRGTGVGIAPVATLQPLLSFFGAGLLGAAVEFSHAPTDMAGSRVLVLPTADAEAVIDTIEPGTKLVGFGEQPADPRITHWETDVWSENPAFPSSGIDPSDPLLVSDRSNYSHRQALSAATRIADRYDLDRSRRVVLRRPLTDPRAVIAGILAPLTAGASVVLTVESDGDSRGNIAVGDGPEPTVLDPETVSL